MNMRDLFPSYDQPTQQEFDELWKEKIIKLQRLQRFVEEKIAELE